MLIPRLRARSHPLIRQESGRFQARIPYQAQPQRSVASTTQEAHQAGFAPEISPEKINVPPARRVSTNRL